MKRMLYAILIFFGVAAQRDMLCSQKEYPKKEKDGLTLARNNKSKKHEFGDAPEVRIILAQAWKGLKGSEKLSDQEIMHRVDCLPHDIQLHVGKFLWNNEIIHRKLNNLMYYISAIAERYHYKVNGNKVEVVKMWADSCGSRPLMDKVHFLVQHFREDTKKSADAKYIIYFNGTLKIPTKLINVLVAQNGKRNDIVFLYAKEAPSSIKDQTTDIRSYFQWLKREKKMLADFEYFEVDYGFVGYSDGSYQYIIHPCHMAHLKMLSSEQIELCRELDLAYKIYDETRKETQHVLRYGEFRINNRMKKVFYTLQRYMQERLIFNYGLDLGDVSKISGFRSFIRKFFGK